MIGIIVAPGFSASTAFTLGISSCKTFFYYIFYVNDLVLPEKWLLRSFVFSLKYPFLAKIVAKIKKQLQK